MATPAATMPYARRVKPTTPRTSSSGSAVSTSERLKTLLTGEHDDVNHVIIVHVQHKLDDGSLVDEIVLGGGSPAANNGGGSTQTRSGPVRRLSSPYRGVSFHSCTQRWRGRIKHGTKSEHLGYFTSDLEAAAAYNVAARKIHGQDAQVNRNVEEIMAQTLACSSRVIERNAVPYANRVASGAAPQPPAHKAVVQPAQPQQRETAPSYVKIEPHTSHAPMAPPPVYPMSSISSESRESMYSYEDYSDCYPSPHSAQPQHEQGEYSSNSSHHINSSFHVSPSVEKVHENSSVMITNNDDDLHYHTIKEEPSAQATTSLSWEDYFVQIWFDGSSTGCHDTPTQVAPSSASESLPFGPSSLDLDGNRCFKRAAYDYSHQPAVDFDCKRIRC
mmetsp:Transcript_15260/g.29585  ORF Transcript_15260/g.29585 Transcript_15260/m.29585 type:complete len:388 (-) Transcript_15260:133-1296(-)